MNPATEFIQALVYPGEQTFSPKHLATFAVETLSDPHIRIKNLSMMIAYILVLIADKATWPGQRERIRKRFADAVGRIPEVKFRYALQIDPRDRGELKLQAKVNSGAVIRECKKVDDAPFERAVSRVLKRRLAVIAISLKYKGSGTIF